MATTFPGGTSVTELEVYSEIAPDGLAGGSPHLHLASTECYVVVGGRGALHTIDAEGFHEIPLRPGAVVWFTPGTIHRALDHDALRVLVVMGNAGLPEAGDAVMTFPADIVRDPAQYRTAATLPARDTTAERARDALARRDFAVEGYLAIRDAILAGDEGPLRAFHQAAAEIVRERAGGWSPLISDGPLAQAEHSLAHVEDLARGRFSHLSNASVHRAPEIVGEPSFGMCGRLRAYDVRGGERLEATRTA